MRALASIGTKQRSRLDIEDEMTVCWSKIDHWLCKTHQAVLSR